MLGKMKILLWIFFFPTMIMYHLINAIFKIINTFSTSQGKINSYYTEVDIPGILRILDDCMQIVQTSKNLDTIINRIDLGKEKAQKLSKLELSGTYTSYLNSEYYFKIL